MLISICDGIYLRWYLSAMVSWSHWAGSREERANEKDDLDIGKSWRSKEEEFGGDQLEEIVHVSSTKRLCAWVLEFFVMLFYQQPSFLSRFS